MTFICNNSRALIVISACIHINIEQNGIIITPGGRESVDNIPDFLQHQFLNRCIYPGVLQKGMVSETFSMSFVLFDRTCTCSALCFSCTDKNNCFPTLIDLFCNETSSWLDFHSFCAPPESCIGNGITFAYYINPESVFKFRDCFTNNDWQILFQRCFFDLLQNIIYVAGNNGIFDESIITDNIDRPSQLKRSRSCFFYLFQC